jgi:DNA-binding GntR family transcriptional regulator/molybdopterin synthase catalytic subunit/molybdopterin converting factor small subunit
VHVEVRLFGGLTERAGAARLHVDVPEDATVADLRTAVAATHPQLAPLLERTTVAVDLEVRRDDHPLAGAEEVALLPPVAGGDGPRIVTGLHRPPLDVVGTLARIGGSEVGGTAVFLGTVRDHAADLDDVVRLDYSAYPAMAERVLAELATELAADHPAVTGIALVHAVGELAVGAHTVLIACAAPHRDEAFDACRDALERVKDRTPVWKREVTASGGHRWVGLPDDAAAPPAADAPSTAPAPPRPPPPATHGPRPVRTRRSAVTEPPTPPRWQQILTDLERRIAEGEIVDRFPTDRELVERYGVSRHTVREAVQRLRARGLVERHRGRGSFVRPDQVRQPVGSLYSLFRAVEGAGLEQRSEVLVLEERADPEAAARLELPAETPLLYLERLRFAGDEPLAIDAVWLPADLARPLLEVDWSRTALYDELAGRCGLRLTRADELIEPTVADADARDLLGLEDGEALFRIERCGRVDDRPVEWRVTLVRGTRFAFTSSWDRTRSVDPVGFGPRPATG